MALTIVIGNKTYSSWSMRAWLALELCSVPYDEIVIPLDQPETAANIAKHSPSGRVPALRHDGVHMWDSLAIVEYLAETFPDAKLWPVDRAARAHARAMCAEMHAGFYAMRERMTFHMKRAPAPVSSSPALDADIARVLAMWRDCQARFGRIEGADGFLFGRATVADAFFAPVVARLRTYAVDVDAATRAYMERVERWPLFQKWKAGALAEAWVAPHHE